MTTHSEKAYQRTVAPFHGWVSRRGFGVALKMTPEWSDVRARAKLPEADDKFRKDLTVLAAATRDVCARLKVVHLELDLEDQRKSI